MWVKICEIAENGQKYLEMAGRTGMVGNGWQWMEMSEVGSKLYGNGWKWLVSLELARTGRK